MGSDVAPKNAPAVEGSSWRRPFKQMKRWQVSVDDLKEEDAIIAVMGPTGSGKSSFINAVMGGGQVVGHGLESCTTEISSVRLESSGLDLIFVDTPGFDDTNKTDLEILKMIADWLKKTYENKVKLSGILYFHRISDNRMAGTPLKNLRMFEQLCGKNALKNIVLTTTMWDEVDEEVGDMREDELKKSYWRTMIQQGSEVARYEGTPESAWKVVEPFLKEAIDRHAVLLQEEMVEFKRQLPDTEAGQAMYGQLESLIKRQYETLQKIRAETKQQTNPGFLEQLREEYADIEDKLQSTIQDMRVLKLPLRRRMLRKLGIRNRKGRAKKN